MSSIRTWQNISSIEAASQISVGLNLKKFQSRLEEESYQEWLFLDIGFGPERAVHRAPPPESSSGFSPQFKLTKGSGAFPCTPNI